MDSVRQIALSFCASAVFCAGVGVLNGKVLEKSGRYIIALILLCSVIGTLASADFSLGFLPENVPALGQSETAEDLSGYSAEYLIASLLKEKGISFEKISANVTKNEGGSIVISEITVFGADNPEAVKETLDACGIDCGVNFA